MFASLFDFSVQRTARQAVVFYFFYVLLIMLASGFIVYLTVPTNQPEQIVIQQSIAMGSNLGILGVVLVAGLTVWKKQLHRNPGMLAVAVLSPVLAYYGGAVLGMLPVAWLGSR